MQRMMMLIVALWIAPAALAPPVVPTGFKVLTIASGMTRPVGMAIAPDGRIFICEQRGIVRVWANGSLLPTPFIDLQDEVQNGQDRGLLGIALDPNFATNRFVYLLYVVDPVFGQPDAALDAETFCRLTRYTGSAASGGNVADLSSRFVLIGATPSQGIPSCHSSHAIGTVMFGLDGSLFVGAGDGAHFDFADAGGAADLPCFQSPLFSADQNVGAFRSQYLDTLAGKVLRIDPATGLGLPSNPYFNGNPDAARSRVWAYGLRNQYRFTIRPGTKGPGTLYVGDVGWNGYEEMNVAKGLGENFGWPCREGLVAAPQYPGLNPMHSSCNTIQTPANPGPLTNPVVAWHHGNFALSTPAQMGFVGNAAAGCAFYAGGKYPALYQGALFFADHIAGWIKVLRTNAADQFVSLTNFATAAEFPVAIVAHPVNGDLYYLALTAGQLRRIRFPIGDLDDNGIVNGLDLALMLGQWTGSSLYAPCPPHAPADLNQDCRINGLDIAMLLGDWG